MPDETKFSQTMRIDLIPDVPSEPRKGKQRVIVSTPSRKQRKVPLKPSETVGDTRYYELLQSIYDAALIADADGHIVDINMRAIEFFHHDRIEFCRLSIPDVISGADASLIRMVWDNLEDERFTLIQAHCVRRDGSFFPSEIAVNKLRLGDEMHLCFFVRDITRRRQAEEMLRTEHNAIQNAGNGIAVADLDAALEYVNPSVAGMWGYDEPKQLMGMPVRNLLSDPQKADEIVRAVLGGRDSWQGEMRAVRKVGDEFDVQIDAACNRNSDGEQVGIVFSFVDVSDRKRAEAAIREAERQRVMLQSLGAACHHLGQPATVLLANLGILQKQLHGRDEKVVELVESSVEAVKKLGAILHKLIAVNEYKTMQYIEGSDDDAPEDNRILDI